MMARVRLCARWMSSGVMNTLMIAMAAWYMTMAASTLRACLCMPLAPATHSGSIRAQLAFLEAITLTAKRNVMASVLLLAVTRNSIVTRTAMTAMAIKTTLITTPRATLCQPLVLATQSGSISAHFSIPHTVRRKLMVLAILTVATTWILAIFRGTSATGAWTTTTTVGFVRRGKLDALAMRRGKNSAPTDGVVNFAGK